MESEKERERDVCGPPRRRRHTHTRGVRGVRGVRARRAWRGHGPPVSARDVLHRDELAGGDAQLALRVLELALEVVDRTDREIYLPHVVRSIGWGRPFFIVKQLLRLNRGFVVFVTFPRPMCPIWFWT